MTTSSTETETDHGIDVVLFVTRLNAAAKAGLALLKAVEGHAATNGASGELREATLAARAAYDRLDVVQKEAT